MSNPAASPGPAPLDGKTFAIGALGVTAVVLFVGFLLVTLTPRPAYAIGQSDRGGDYVMITQQVSNSTEVVCIIDAAVKRMNVYAVQESARSIRLIQSNVPLDALPKTPEQERRARQKP
jgi:hypothetical protein